MFGAAGGHSGLVTEEKVTKKVASKLLPATSSNKISSNTATWKVKLAQFLAMVDDKDSLPPWNFDNLTILEAIHRNANDLD
jgi:hypothetical protein